MLRIREISLSFFIAFCFYITAIDQARAQHNDQIQLCKLSNGKTWYFAIGRTVFEIKNPGYSVGSPLISDVAPQYALTPPDPNAPIGCKDNPQQLEGFSIGAWPLFEAKTYSGDMPQSLDGLGLGRYPYSNDVPPQIDPQIQELETVVLKCRNKKFITRFDDGTLLCANKRGELNPLLNTGSFHFGVGWEFIISGTLYLTPLGQNLVVAEDTTSVGVNYLLAPGVAFGYRWFLPITASSVNETYLIKVDKVVRSKILGSEIKNYSWPKT